MHKDALELRLKTKLAFKAHLESQLKDIFRDRRAATLEHHRRHYNEEIWYTSLALRNVKAEIRGLNQMKERSTITGRLVDLRPHLQNIAPRSETARELRKVFAEPLPRNESMRVLFATLYGKRD